MKFNQDQLRIDLVTERCVKRGTDLKTASAEIGISISTLHRLENQKTVPDVNVLAKLCTWLGTSPEVYFIP